MNNKKNFILIFLEIFAAFLILISIAFGVAIVVNFFGMPLSKEMTDWGEFGSYASFIISMLNLVFFIILTYKALEFERNSYTRQAEFQKKTFTQQMIAQKIALQTDFRKSHIEDVRHRMFELNNLTKYDLKDKDGFKKFKRECESIIRIFKIYSVNKNTELVGICDYGNVIEQFKELEEVMSKVPKDSGADDNQCNSIYTKLNNANIEMIGLEKCLSDFTLLELKKAFE